MVKCIQLPINTPEGTIIFALNLEQQKINISIKNRKSEKEETIVLSWDEFIDAANTLKKVSPELTQPSIAPDMMSDQLKRLMEELNKKKKDCEPLQKQKYPFGTGPIIPPHDPFGEGIKIRF